jgi:hypothetical protein
MRIKLRLFILLAAMLAPPACGRAPSSLLRQGQLPVYDFPLYLSEGATGVIWKYSRDRTRTQLVSGLDNPLGVATDKWGNLFVAQASNSAAGTGSIVRIDVDSGARTVIATGLDSPSEVAVDSFGEVYVVQDLAKNVVRARDKKVITAGFAGPPALGFGVGDLMVTADSDSSVNKVFWGSTSGPVATDAQQPVNIGVDGMGRVFVAEGLTSLARVLRYDQTSGGTGTPVAEKLSGPRGLAVDAVGNLYIVEVGKLRVALVTFDGQIFSWSAGLGDPQFLAFTQY